MTETVLVTGGTGFIAGWCIVELLKLGYSVRTTIRSPTKEGAVRGAVGSITGTTDRLSFVVADLMDDEGWDAALAGCDYVLHVASPLGGRAAGDRDAFVGPARDGTLRVLNAAVRARIKRVVMTSAAATARPPLASNLISDETMWANPDDPQFDAYRVSKILAERAAWDFMKEDGGQTEFTTVLPGAVFGPILNTDNLGSVKIIQDLLQGKPRALPRLGFWIVDVRDLAKIHIQAMTSQKAAGERFIATGEFLWMEDIARLLRENFGSSAALTPTRRLPNIVVKLLLPFMPNFRTLAPLIGRKFALTSEKARRQLDFAPRPATQTILDCARSLLTGTEST